ncbi:MAG: cyclic nucleotide-binding domain-containing protein [Lachnospiraceae bacterium]|nr:cyclic nucleotide-binding domain-containing protein [Lachnospiraceae bacterium]
MADAKLVKYEAESVILREGEINSEMFKIVKGHAEVYVDYGSEQETLIGIIGEHSCFGEFGLLLHKPSIYTVVAYSDVYVMLIREGEMGDFVRENHRNIMEIMRNMARTMYTMRFQIDLLLKEISAGKKPDEKMLAEARRAMRGYGMYRSIEEAVDGLSKFSEKV